MNIDVSLDWFVELYSHSRKTTISECLGCMKDMILLKATHLGTISRACLYQHLIAIRLPGRHGDHVRSGTSLIAIISIAQLRSQSSAAQIRTEPHLSTVINCRLLHATWWGGWELLQHQWPVVHCAGRSEGA